MFSNFFLGALYLQHVKGYSSLGTGLAFLPSTLVLGALSLGITATLMRRFGPRALLIPGMVTITAALVLLSTAGDQASYFPAIFAAYLLFGIGAGISFMPLMTIMMAEVPAADSGVASGVANVTMQVGAALGLAALATISTDHTRSLVAQGHSVVSALTGGYQLGFAIAAVCVVAGLLIVLVVLRSPAEARRPQRAIERETEVEEREAA
jgi:MFS family permease